MKTEDQKVSQNGSAKNGATTEVKAVTKAPRTRITKEKKPVATTPKKKEEPKPLSFEEKKEKFHEMFELTKKHSKLSKTIQKLEELLTPKDPMENNLTLFIHSGTTGNYVSDFDFKTTNSLIIVHALHFLKGKAAEYLKSLEDEIIKTTV